MPTGVFTRPVRAKSIKIGSDKTTGGVTRNASKKTRNAGHQKKCNWLAHMQQVDLPLGKKLH
jgi:hypothetical protein